jgi:hypothetical protein
MRRKIHHVKPKMRCVRRLEQEAETSRRPEHLA